MIRSELEKALLETGLIVPEQTIQSFETYAAELQKWNRKFNLTAICRDRDIAIKHLIDALFFINGVSLGGCIMDIGSGAGIPAIPLKIVRPDIRVISVDAVGKKIMFQKHVSRLLGLDGFEALHTRVENLHDSHAGLCDVITSRAFSRLDLFAALAAPLLKCNGKLVAMKGPDIHGEIEAVKDSVRQAGFLIGPVSEYLLPMEMGRRTLVTLVPVNTHK